jgi:hypothetical protein
MLFYPHSPHYPNLIFRHRPLPNQLWLQLLCFPLDQIRSKSAFFQHLHRHLIPTHLSFNLVFLFLPHHPHAIFVEVVQVTHVQLLFRLRNVEKLFFSLGLGWWVLVQE